ncbi:MAG: ABC transporter permease [Chloroflexota bacterium]
MMMETPGATGRLRRETTEAQPLRTVLSWELRRLSVDHFGWAMAGAALLLFVALLWFKHFWMVQVSDGGARFQVLGSSADGMLLEIVFVLLLLFGMFLPFVAAEGVARDYKLHVHELLMATSMPGWAYVGGRYLAGLVVSNALALELLLAAFLVNSGLHLSQPGYPAPDLAALMAAWAITVLPGAVLLGSASFALGTLWPRRATILKLGVLIVWVAFFIVDPSSLPTWFADWNPTSNSLAATSERQMATQFKQHGQTLAAARAAQAQLPDMQQWLLPHFGLIAIGLLLALATVAGFRRFRAVL